MIFFFYKTYSIREVLGSSKKKGPRWEKGEEISPGLIYPTKGHADSSAMWGESHNLATPFHHPDLLLSDFTPWNLCPSWDLFAATHDLWAPSYALLHIHPPPLEEQTLLLYGSSSFATLPKAWGLRTLLLFCVLPQDALWALKLLHSFVCFCQKSCRFHYTCFPIWPIEF